MKILYAIQATGNGHISRANQLIPYFSTYGQVDVLLSGQNAQLKVPVPVTYRCNGISLFYNKKGGLNLSGILAKNEWRKSLHLAKQLPVEKYDVVINDFEPITALACRQKNKASIQLSHQASFLSQLVPRPAFKNPLGEFILKNYSFSSHFMGFHFKKYAENIFTPIIKNELLTCTPRDLGHITVYLNGLNKEYYLRHFIPLQDVLFHCFLPEITNIERIKNIIFYPVSYADFTQSMIHCHGVITGGGFETPSEALYLGKKLLCIPIRNHYEQACNAAALRNMGIMTLAPSKLKSLHQYIHRWLERGQPGAEMIPSDAGQVVAQVMDKMLPA